MMGVQCPNSSVFSSFPPDGGPHLLRSLVELACYPRLESGFDAAEQTSIKTIIHRESRDFIFLRGRMNGQ
jgi:hypothetical protein